MTFNDECTKEKLKQKGHFTFWRVQVWIILIATFISEAGFGQVKDVGIPGVVNYSKSEYKGGTQNWGIAQDSNGFMYFANNNGVLRFDGIHWDLIEVSQSAAVRSIHIDEDNTIFVGLYNDFGIIEKTDAGNYSYRSLRELLPDGFQNFDEIWKIYSINEGTLFQSFDNIFMLSNNVIKVIEPSSRFHFSFLIDGNFYVNEPDEGLFVLSDGKTKKLGWSDGLAGMEVWGMTGLSNGNMLVGTNTNGLYLLENGILKKWDTPAGQMVERFQLYCMVPLGNDYMAFGTILNGIVISDSKGEIVQHLDISNGLQNNTILSIFSDANQNLWLGLDNGIDYLNINSPISYSNSKERIGTGYACTIHAGKIYLGTNQGLYVKSFGPLAPVDEDFTLVENTIGQVWSLDVFDGQLICGHNSGILLIEGNKATRIGSEEGVWRFIPLAGEPGVLLGGSYNGLLTLVKGENGWRVQTRIKGFNESSRFIGQDEHGMVWVSHGSKGVFKLELNQALDSVLHYKLYTSDNGLPSSEQNILFQFNGKSYVSTIAGIYRYRSDSDTFMPTDDLKQFPITGQLKTIQTDDPGNYWFISSDESGVFRFNKDLSYTKVNLPFRQLDGKYVNGFEYVYPYNDEHIIFGIDNGFAHYTSKFNKQYDWPLKAFITEVEATYIDSVIFLPDSGMAASRFPHDKNAFMIHYTAPFFEHQEVVEFSFNLDDYQKEWSPWSVINYKEYTNLPQGKYKFNLKARNIYGVESNIATYEFEILPPWYNSAAARIIYLLMFFGLLLLVLKLIQHQVNKTKRRVIQSHKTELKQKEEKYQLQKLMTEREIIKLRNEKLEGEMVYRNKELANQTMGLIQKNKFLVILKDELLKIGKNTSEEKTKKRLGEITRNINKEIDNKQQHQLFETYFEEVHYDFFKSLKSKFPDLTPRDMRLCAYIKMNLTSKEIAALLNISDRGVEISRYRLRKKMKLSRDTNLSTYLSNI